MADVAVSIILVVSSIQKEMGISSRKLIAAVSILTGLVILYRLFRSVAKDKLTFVVDKTWDGRPLRDGKAEVTVSVGDTDHVRLDIKAPFYNDPAAPSGPSGKPFDQLWDYEVVEAFFLSESGKYLEVEFCPHGQHLILMLDGKRNMVKDKLNVAFTSIIDNNMWTGTALIPFEYFPLKVSKFNAYAIHGSGEARVYESYMAVPGSQPDFHRLEYFDKVDFSKIIPEASQQGRLWNLEN